MYGYLRLDSKTAPAEIRRFYRQEYCSLCHALWKYYGYKPRFLLSYDITFMAALLNLDPQIMFNEKKPICYFRKDIETDKERWKKLSAISVLLSAEKLRDNINDENSLLAKIIVKIFSRSIRMAEKDYPELSVFLKNGFLQMSAVEKNNGSVEELAKAFSDIMVGAKVLLFGESQFDEAVLGHVASWIYFIDAVDDLDKDAKEGSYNPLLKVATSRDDLICNHFDFVEEFIKNQCSKLAPHMRELDINTYRGMTVLNVLNYAIPKVTSNVLKGRKPHDSVHIHVKYVESKGGIVFA